MVFHINNKYNNAAVTYLTFFDAPIKINRYRTGVAELALDKLLRKKYKLSLKQMCLILYTNCTVHEQNSEFIISFKTKEFDDIATLITYGNGKVQGSNILKYAFSRE